MIYGMYVNDSTQSILFYRFMFKKEGTNTWAIVIDQLKSMVPSSFIQNWYLWFIEMGFFSTYNTTYLHFYKHTDINLIIVIKWRK